jgi:hypothetical protein
MKLPFGNRANVKAETLISAKRKRDFSGPLQA